MLAKIDSYELTIFGVSQTGITDLKSNETAYLGRLAIFISDSFLFLYNFLSCTGMYLGYLSALIRSVSYNPFCAFVSFISVDFSIKKTTIMDFLYTVFF